jgi:hypothetical protein
MVKCHEDQDFEEMNRTFAYGFGDFLVKLASSLAEVSLAMRTMITLLIV